jgi:hypothetical protein
MATYHNLFGAEASLDTKSGSIKYYRPPPLLALSSTSG